MDEQNEAGDVCEMDAKTQMLWREEVKQRILAHRANPEPTFSEEEVFADLLQP